MIITTNSPKSPPDLLSMQHLSYPCIVIVEDDYDDKEFLSEVLDTELPKCTYVHFTNSVKALQYLQQDCTERAPSLIVLDYNMPVINGVELLEILKKEKHLNAVPKVIYSHSANPRHKESCQATGAIAYIEKGNSIEEIRENVQQMLSYCIH